MTIELNPGKKNLEFYILNMKSFCKNKLKVVNLGHSALTGPNLEQLYLNINGIL